MYPNILSQKYKVSYIKNMPSYKGRGFKPKIFGKQTGKVSENQTLARRLIRYHVYLKGRAPNTRLDWKLTLADYLGANEIMYDSSYPGADTLRENPINGDRTAIKRLNRSQRNTLIQTLVDIFNQE